MEINLQERGNKMMVTLIYFIILGLAVLYTSWRLSKVIVRVDDLEKSLYRNTEKEDKDNKW